MRGHRYVLALQLRLRLFPHFSSKFCCPHIKCLLCHTQLTQRYERTESFAQCLGKATADLEPAAKQSFDSLLQMSQEKVASLKCEAESKYKYPVFATFTPWNVGVIFLSRFPESDKEMVGICEQIPSLRFSFPLLLIPKQLSSFS